ncbi:arginine--tRNA ligase [Tuwongella immobilis]|nr:arginine--tRNA ligase [Tuwongella immobilis]
MVRMIRPSSDPKYGDYQANFAMSMAKQLGKAPRDLASELVIKVPTGPELMFEKLEVAGGGFINMTLSASFLQSALRAMSADAQLGISPPEKPLTVVIDYSGPNVAKPLHVGHLRSTIIGEALSRIYRFLGHTVIGDNHLGDWGTQFGILLYGYKHFLDAEAYQADPVRELARLYVHVRSLFVKKDEDSEDDGPVADPVAEACRFETAKLHEGDPENRALWQQFMPHCLKEIHDIYERLDVHFDTEHGESYYQPQLASVVEDMLAKGIAKESQGAVVIPNAKGVIPQSDEERKTEEPPALVRKRDGAFTYTTTDLATIRYRADNYQPDRLLYVVDFRQELHFRTLFAQAARWGYGHIDMRHLKFGSVLGKDGKPISTRKGGGFELGDLLDEAVRMGASKYAQTRKERLERGEDVPEMSPEQQRDIAEVVGVGAVKYADLSSNRESNYVFDFDKMLATEGNTSTYMQYAYVRCRGIFRKGGIDADALRASQPTMIIGTAAEKALALQLLRFGDALQAAASGAVPHLISAYLWDLAKSYSTFFVNCPVLKAETEELRDSRLILCDLTARVIQKSLHLLGIRTVEMM